MEVWETGFKAVRGYVTFEFENGRHEAQRLYPSGVRGLWQKPEQRLRGKHRLYVRRAEEPSDIIWENLGA